MYLRVLRDQLEALRRWEEHNSLQCEAPRQIRVLEAHHKTCRRQHQRSPNHPNIVNAFIVSSYEMLLSNIFNVAPGDRSYIPKTSARAYNILLQEVTRSKQAQLVSEKL